MKHTRISLLAGILAMAAGVQAGCSTPGTQGSEHAADLTSVDRFTLVGSRHLVRDIDPLDAVGNINVVVEIPTGTVAKWEVNKDKGTLEWEFRQGQPRVVAYLGYPGNYGMIPGTFLPKEAGGDGDPLDVLILGPALPRGSIVPARAIGILKMLDGGEADDKIIAVNPDSAFGEIASMEALKREFDGAAEIIEIWFTNYKGPGTVESRGFAGVAEARKFIAAAMEAYSRYSGAVD